MVAMTSHMDHVLDVSRRTGVISVIRNPHYEAKNDITKTSVKPSYASTGITTGIIAGSTSATGSGVEQAVKIF